MVHIAGQSMSIHKEMIADADARPPVAPAPSIDAVQWTPSVGPSLTSTMIGNYDGNEPIKCPKCLNMVVPEEERIPSCRQCLHSFWCCLCIRHNRCGCKDCNEDLRDVIMVCPRCHGTIASN